jgi:hypothetical protein
MRSKIKKLKSVIAIGVALFIATVGIVQTLTDDDSSNALPEPVLTVEIPAPSLETGPEFVYVPKEEIKRVKTKKSESAISLSVHTIGYALSTALSVALRTLVTPFVGKLLFWICMVMVTIAALAIGLKTAFPDISLRELFTPKNIAAVLLGLIISAALCEFLPEYFSELEEWRLYIRFGVTLLVTFVLTHAMEKTIFQRFPE